jgi:hypothetical protein
MIRTRPARALVALTLVAEAVLLAAAKPLGAATYTVSTTAELVAAKNAANRIRGRC